MVKKASGMSLVSMLVGLALSVTIAAGLIQIFTAISVSFQRAQAMSFIQENAVLAIKAFRETYQQTGANMPTYRRDRVFRTSHSGSHAPDLASDTSGREGWRYLGCYSNLWSNFFNDYTFNSDPRNCFNGNAVDIYSPYVGVSDSWQMWCAYLNKSGLNVWPPRNRDVLDQRLRQNPAECNRTRYGRNSGGSSRYTVYEKIISPLAGINSSSLTNQYHITAAYQTNKQGGVIRDCIGREVPAGEYIYSMFSLREFTVFTPSQFFTQAGQPALGCTSWAEGLNSTLSTEESIIAQGVETFQIMYGYPLTPDRDSYRYEYYQQSNWYKYDSVRIGFVVRSDREIYPTARAQTFRLVHDTNVFTANDRYLRKAFHLTIPLQRKELSYDW